MPQLGRDFEVAVTSVISRWTADLENIEVRHDVKVDGPDGPRQIDVLVEGKVGLIPIRIVIECKDKKSAIKVGVVDELESKMRDVAATAGVLVSRSGFQAGARKKAKRTGITLLRLDQAASFDSELEITLLIDELQVTTIQPEVQVTVLVQSSFDAASLYEAMEQAGWTEAFHHHLTASGLGLHEFGEGDHRWAPDEPFATYQVDERGLRHPLTVSAVDFTVSRNRYFGRVAAVPNSLIFENVLTAEHELILDGDELLRTYQESFLAIAGEGDIAAPAAASIKTSVFPTNYLGKMILESMTGFTESGELRTHYPRVQLGPRGSTTPPACGA